MSVTFYNVQQPAVWNDDYTYLLSGIADINLANGNAQMIFEVLKVEENEDLCGSLSAKDFAVVCRRALLRLDNVTGLDKGRPESISQEVGRATLIQCGINHGYVREKIVLLLNLATASNPTDTIVWC